MTTKTSQRKPPIQTEPEPPFPAKHEEKPGLQSQLKPRPRYLAPWYKGAGKLDGKVALITSGDSGIGRAVAVLFAREGANIAITVLPTQRTDAAETRRAVEAEGRRCAVIEIDLSHREGCQEAVETTTREFGTLDILVSNSVHHTRKRQLVDVTKDVWERTLNTNIYAYFWLVQAALPHLKPGSAVIATGSITGAQSSELPAKGAIRTLTKSLAQSLLERGVRVNCVAPGPIWTPLNAAETPLKRRAQPEEIAPAYVFFASDADSSFITGEVLTALGVETTGN